MADNLALPPSGATAATDKVTYSGDANVDVQLVRVVQSTGAEGSKTVVESMPASLGQKTKAASLPVVLASDQDALAVSGTVTASGTVGLDAGTNNIGDVDILTVPSPLSTAGAGTAAAAHRVTLASDDPAVAALQILDNIVSGSEAQVDIVAALPAGTNAIGKLAANSGVDIGDVDILSSALPTGAATSANQLLPITATSATLTNTNDSASNVTVQASNAARKGLILFNDSTQVAYVKFGATATTTSFSVYLPAQGTYEMGSNIYSGIVDAIWAADGAGAMRATEW